MTKNRTRRAFLAGSIAVAGTMVGTTGLKRYLRSASSKPSPQTTISERLLGNTGVRVPILGLGGAGKTPLSWDGAEQQAIAIIQRALELGIRYFDTAADYGPSEDYLAKVLPGYREQVFLASKTAQRDRDGAWRELERSLKRLQTDYQENGFKAPSL